MLSLGELSAEEIVTGLLAFSKYSRIGERVLNRTILNLSDELGILKDCAAVHGVGDEPPYFEDVERVLSGNITWRLIYHYDVGSGWIYEIPSKETLEQQLTSPPFKLENEDVESLRKIANKFDETALKVAEENKEKIGYFLQ